MAHSEAQLNVNWREQYHLAVQELLSERRSADALERAIGKLEAEIERAHRQLDRLGIPRTMEGKRLDLAARISYLRRALTTSTPQHISEPMRFACMPRLAVATLEEM